MNICLIKNEATNTDIGYLFYYEESDTYIVELSDEADDGDMPFFLAIFNEKGIKTIDPIASKRWVETRIIPSDRQNLGSILRKNKLQNYDVFKLLMIAEGRCSMDECSIKKTSPNYPNWLFDRVSKKIRNTTISKHTFLIELSNHELYLLDSRMAFDGKLKAFLERTNELDSYDIIPGGNGLWWNENAYIMTDDILAKATKLDIPDLMIEDFIDQNVLSTIEVCRELNCTRQYVNNLVNNGKLKAHKEVGNNRFFLRSDINNIKWQR